MISTLKLVTKLGFNLIFTFCLLGLLHAQKHDYNWLLGNENLLIEGNGISVLDFNTSPVNILLKPEIALGFDTANAYASDSSGVLQFYTNGCEIFNKNHQLIENGDILNPGNVYADYCANGSTPAYPSGTQSMLVLPFPNSSNQYLLIYKHLTYLQEITYTLWSEQTRAALIDMNQNQGNGKVIWRDVILLEDANRGMLTGVQHVNGIDWWLVDSKELENKYIITYINAEGIDSSFTQSIGHIPLEGGFGGGQAKFSSDGTLYARYSPDDDLMLFDFDRETGLLSNFRFISVELDGEVVGGIEFSASGQFLYIASNTYLLQFDLWANDVEASMQVVGEYDGYVSPFPTTFYRIERGPDCRIYVFCGSCDVLHVIQKPDEPGLDCQFEQHIIQLPDHNFRTAPHFPNYRLGPLDNEGEPCTPLITSSSTPISIQTKVEVFPNPSQGNIHLRLPSSLRSFSYQLEVFDQLGQRLLNTTVQSQQELIDIQILPQGMYFWKLTKGGSLLDSGRLVKQ